MGEANPDLPQVNDPELVANLIRLLQVRGPLGVMGVLDTVVPVVDMGQVVTPNINVRAPFFATADAHSNGIFTAAAINTIHADTGDLPAGTYDLRFLVTGADAANRNQSLQLQHRNAANTSNREVWEHLISHNNNRDLTPAYVYSLSYVLEQDERLRILNTIAMPANSVSYAQIFAHLRT